MKKIYFMIVIFFLYDDLLGQVKPEDIIIEQINIYKNDIDGLIKKIDSLNNMILLDNLIKRDREIRINELQTEKNKLEQEKEKNKKRIEELLKDIENYKKDVEIVNTLKNQLSNQIDELNNKIKKLEEKMVMLEIKVITLSDTILSRAKKSVRIYAKIKKEGNPIVIKNKGKLNHKTKNIEYIYIYTPNDLNFNRNHSYKAKIYINDKKEDYEPIIFYYGDDDSVKNLLLPKINGKHSKYIGGSYKIEIYYEYKDIDGVTKNDKYLNLEFSIEK